MRMTWAIHPRETRTLMRAGVGAGRATLRYVANDDAPDHMAIRTLGARLIHRVRHVGRHIPVVIAGHALECGHRSVREELLGVLLGCHLTDAISSHACDARNPPT